jgi:hypothetical protein
MSDQLVSEAGVEPVRLCPGFRRRPLAGRGVGRRGGQAQPHMAEWRPIGTHTGSCVVRRHRRRQVWVATGRRRGWRLPASGRDTQCVPGHTACVASAVLQLINGEPAVARGDSEFGRHNTATIGNMSKWLENLGSLLTKDAIWQGVGNPTRNRSCCFAEPCTPRVAGSASIGGSRPAVHPISCCLVVDLPCSSTVVGGCDPAPRPHPGHGVDEGAGRQHAAAATGREAEHRTTCTSVGIGVGVGVGDQGPADEPVPAWPPRRGARPAALGRRRRGGPTPSPLTVARVLHHVPRLGFWDPGWSSIGRCGTSTSRQACASK